MSKKRAHRPSRFAASVGLETSPDVTQGWLLTKKTIGNQALHGLVKNIVGLVFHVLFGAGVSSGTRHCGRYAALG